VFAINGALYYTVLCTFALAAMNKDSPIIMYVLGYCVIGVMIYNFAKTFDRATVNKKLQKVGCYLFAIFFVVKDLAFDMYVKNSFVL